MTEIIRTRNPIVLAHGGFLLAALMFAACSAPLASARSLVRIDQKPAMTHFADDAALKAYLEELKKKLTPPTQRAKNSAGLQYEAMTTTAPLASPAPAAPPAAGMDASVSTGAKAAEADSVTNVQTAGVDEGGIVKVHNDHLVILRRGRLFTVRIGGNDLKPVSSIDAFGPGIEPGGAWYDEMLLRGNTIVVIGYSYQRGGTEVGLFDIDNKGGLSYRATYHLRSNDYYSSRNYASRLIGDSLIFYTPLTLNLWGDPFAGFPAMRKWQGKADRNDFKPIAPATRIYRTDDSVEPYGLTLHTVTVCNLGKRDMECEATAVLGPQGRVFYVAQNAVYVWVTDHRRTESRPNEARAQSSIFRIPLDGAAPRALKASGAPIDQFSFLESDDGHLNVLVRANAKGDGMWSAETSAGDTALLRLRVDQFGDGRETVPVANYTPLPNPAGYPVQNRFIGEYLLYGSGNSWGPPKPAARNALHALRWAQPDTCLLYTSPSPRD